MSILSEKYFLQIKKNSIQWTTHSFVVYSFTTFLKKQYLHLSGCSGISLLWKSWKLKTFQKVTGFWKPVLPAQQSTIQHMPPVNATKNGPEVVWSCPVCLPHTALKGPLCVAFFCLQTAGLTWCSLKHRSKCRGEQQQPTTSAAHLRFTQRALWQLLAAVQLGAGKGPIKKIGKFLCFQKVVNFILFQANFPIIPSPKPECCL